MPTTLRHLPDTTPVQTYLANDHAPGLARLFTRARLGEWDLRHMTDDVAQVVSELIANAVQYGGGSFVTFHMQHTTTSVVVCVWDASPAVPVTRDLGDDAESGRGLIITRAISERVDCLRPSWGGKIVWASVAKETGGPGNRATEAQHP